jgi:HlyD family secretion protein
MKSFRSTFAITLVVLALAGSAYAYYRLEYLPVQAAPAPALQTARVRRGDIVITTPGVGTLLPASQVDLSFRSSGILAEQYASVGDYVETGAVIARLDDSAAQAQVAQAEIALQALLSPAALLEAELAVYTAEKAVDEAAARLEKLVSPQVRQAEIELEAARSALAQAAAGSEDAADAALRLEEAQAAYDEAQLYYQDTYLPAYFTLTETDPLTRLKTEVLVPPSTAEINQARLSLSLAHQKLDEAGLYFAHLQGEPLTPEQRLQSGGAALNKLDQAQLSLENAHTALENTRLVAPIAGVITRFSGAVGQSTGSSPLVTIASMDSLRLRIYADESDLPLLSPGSRVQITLEAYPDHTLAGVLLSLEPALASFEGRPVVATWASVEPDPELTLLSGMAAEVEIISGEAYDALLVPKAALRELAPGAYAVFLVQDGGELVLTPVSVGLQDFTSAEIRSGLSQGDVVSTGTLETK